MLERLDKIKLIENVLNRMNGKHSNRLMDISIDKLQKGESKIYLHNDKEMAILLIDGDVTIKWEDEEVNANRTSVFDEEPTCLHVCKNVEVQIIANSEVEILVQLTVNEEKFKSKLYNK